MIGTLGLRRWFLVCVRAFLLGGFGSSWFAFLSFGWVLVFSCCVIVVVGLVVGCWFGAGFLLALVIVVLAAADFEQCCGGFAGAFGGF